MLNLFCIGTGSARRGACVAVVMAASLLLVGCTDLFFYPSRQQVLSPQQMGLLAEDVTLHSADGTRLFAWHLRSDSARGIVCFFHGNAENISTHITNVAWLPPAGFEVLLVDYRGYGASAGEAEFPDVLEDVQAGLDWCFARGGAQKLPVYAFGQSLGAALTLDVSARAANRSRLAGVVADSGFSSYRRIARDALSNAWLLAPLQYPLSWLVTGKHAPEEAVRQLGDVPLLVLHSVDDTVVPYAHAQRILAAAAGPRCFQPTHGPHNAALNPGFPGSVAYRQAMLDFLRAAAGPGAFACPPPLRDTFLPSTPE